MVRNFLRQALAASRLRVATVVVLTCLLWIGLFQLFANSFHFLSASISDQATKDAAVRAIFNVFFASLTVMLLASNAILVYGALFRGDEARFLFTLPVRGERIFAHKFQESLLFSSWGFVLLGSPLLTAYGVSANAGGFYFATFLPFLLAFAVIPAAMGATLSLLVVRLLPKMRWRFFAWAAAAFACCGAWLLYRFVASGEHDLLSAGWFRDLLGRLKFAERRLLPSWWLSSGLLEAARAGWRFPNELSALRESAWFLAFTIANSLAAVQAAVWVAARTYRTAYGNLATRGSAGGIGGFGWLDWAFAKSVWFLSPQMRLLMLKDLRLFRRDPLQWLQGSIFFALFSFYFFNIRSLPFDANFAYAMILLSFMNLAVIGLILSAFTTRFIFPLISLEGRRFWVLGLLPVKRDAILWSKFLFTFVGSAGPSLVLVAIGDAVLRVPPLVAGVQLLACLAMCSGLSAIAVGLGARMPNLREDSPSRIAAGFGGTLNLVLSTVLILAVVLLTGVPSQRHFVTTHKIDGTLADLGAYPIGMVFAGAAASTALGVVATVVALAVGVRAFRKLEF